jgi:hypothetical protein
MTSLRKRVRPGRGAGAGVGADRDLALDASRIASSSNAGALVRRERVMLRVSTLSHVSWRHSPLSRTPLCRSFSCTPHRHSDLKVSEPSKKYSDTLLLPKTSFPLYGDPETSEVAFRRKTSDELYRWQVGPPFHVELARSLTFEVVGKCEGSTLCSSRWPTVRQWRYPHG